MCADDGVANEGPEGGGDEPGVYGGDDGESGGGLVEEGAGVDELEGEGEEVEDEEDAELDPTWKGSVRREGVERICTEEGAMMNAPTAALLRVVQKMRRRTKMMLRPDAMIWAMLASEPSLPTRGMPQSGLMPTGAEDESAETPVSTDESCVWSCGMASLVLSRGERGS